MAYAPAGLVAVAGVDTEADPVTPLVASDWPLTKPVNVALRAGLAAPRTRVLSSARTVRTARATVRLAAPEVLVSASARPTNTAVRLGWVPAGSAAVVELDRAATQVEGVRPADGGGQDAGPAVHGGRGGGQADGRGGRGELERADIDPAPDAAGEAALVGRDEHRLTVASVDGGAAE